MTFIEMLHRRRSCRRFRPTPIDRASMDSMLRAVMTAPSSKNCRSTRLAVVEDKAMLEKISLMRSSGSSFAKDAAAAVVVMAEQSLTDLWVDNCSISAITLQYAAESLGIGSCWMHVNGRNHSESEPEQGTATEYLQKALDLPSNLNILCVIALGYPAEEPNPRKEQDDRDKVFFL